jgi:hypothetical protein
MARSTPAQKPRGEQRRILSGGFSRRGCIFIFAPSARSYIVRDRTLASGHFEKALDAPVGAN